MERFLAIVTKSVSLGHYVNLTNHIQMDFEIHLDYMELVNKQLHNHLLRIKELLKQIKQYYTHSLYVEKATDILNSDSPVVMYKYQSN